MQYRTEQLIADIMLLDKVPKKLLIAAGLIHGLNATVNDPI